MGRHANTKIWEYCEYISDRVAKCRICRARIKTPGKSRGSMVRHLFNLHGINVYMSGLNAGKVLEKIPSKRGREINESLSSSDHNLFRSFKRENSIDLDTQEDGDEYTISSITQSDDLSSNDVLHHDGMQQLINDEESGPPKLPIIKCEPEGTILSEPQNKPKQDHVDAENDNEELNMSLSDPLIDLNVEPQEPPLAHITSDRDIDCPDNPQPQLPYKHNLKQAKHASAEDQNYLERLKAEALVVKLKAEARYFNELANLTRSKRIFVDIQCQKLRRQMKNNPQN